MKFLIWASYETGFCYFYSQNSRSDSAESDVVLIKEFNQDIVSDLTADTEHFSVFGHGLNQIPDILVLDHCIPPVDSCARESAFMVMPLRRLSVFALLISLGIRPARCGYYNTGIGSRVVAKLTSKWKILTFEMQILRKYGQKQAYLKQNMNKWIRAGFGTGEGEPSESLPGMPGYTIYWNPIGNHKPALRRARGFFLRWILKNLWRCVIIYYSG